MGDILSETNNKGSIYIDIDGLTFGPVDEVAPPPSIHSAKPSDVEYSITHYLLRSPITLGADCQREAWEEYQNFSKACAKQAVHLAENWSKIANPAWVGDFRNYLKTSGKVDPSVVDEIRCSFVLTPKIQAYCFPSERRIEVSAVSATHLRTVNLLLWSLTAELRRAIGPRGLGGKPSESEASSTVREMVDKEAWMAGKDYVDFLLPHLFSLYFSNVNYSSLPIPRAPSKVTFMRAKESASVQMSFMLAHEYAHLIFHDGKAPSITLEREADAFAYELLLDGEEYWKNDTGMLLTSCRWFFLYLTLDRIIGAALSGYDVNWIDVPIREREDWLIERMADFTFPSEEERDSQFLGDLILFQAKQRLRERGVDWIRSAAKKFEEEHCFSG